MSDNRFSQSISNSQIFGGIQGAQGNDIQQSQLTNSGNASNQVDQDKARIILEQLSELLKNSSLPEMLKEDSTVYLDAARKAINRDEPNKELIKVNLKGMAETLQDASNTVEESKALWDRVKPALVQLISWLGVAKNYFGF
ncbi:hypothetical protein H6G00_25995 [Leptolyngbya sp. FACHB-541]|uniref:hypothetical protein n=1 Tax=Leptolyngbya sp. FACHB-541 TaxID=2692810 RepID=UPI0016843A44|nr:hypothetical protein [Leptolyngbya sp. FACHB-541]MBD2000023.1 hypothetical protein [Leptolyngbya sp. FACHB-541]